ncbi:MAG: sulfurtransferase [Acidobacteria bacterium]|nr:sulfurtransferase [Acidobacteriota bacterium]MBK8809943.1 sulfurtransferase [Acidobacteriota bacterium]
MAQKLSPLIHASELGSLSDPVLIDVRTGPDARDRYEAEHLAGALFVDLNTDLADIKPDPADGGRHPLPSVGDFADLLQRLGISPECHVVAYDDKSGANAAARFWWMLRAAGHEKVQLLDGGYDAAVDAGFPTISGDETSNRVGEYKIANWKLPVAGIDEVERARQVDNFLVIDVREKDRFDGLREPLDLIAGHIPGAVNVPFAENLDDYGFFRSPEELREKYAEIVADRKPSDVIVHCGSGVTACHTILAFDYAGFEIPKLYVGSWSEWSRSDRPRSPRSIA